MEQAKAIIENLLEDKKSGLEDTKSEIETLVKRLSILNTKKERLHIEVQQLERTLQLIRMNHPATLGTTTVGECPPKVQEY